MKTKICRGALIKSILILSIFTLGFGIVYTFQQNVLSASAADNYTTFTIKKVDQYGNPVEGAEFEVWETLYSMYGNSVPGKDKWILKDKKVYSLEWHRVISIDGSAYSLVLELDNLTLKNGGYVFTFRDDREELFGLNSQILAGEMIDPVSIQDDIDIHVDSMEEFFYMVDWEKSVSGIYLLGPIYKQGAQGESTFLIDTDDVTPDNIESYLITIEDENIITDYNLGYSSRHVAEPIKIKHKVSSNITDSLGTISLPYIDNDTIKYFAETSLLSGSTSAFINNYGRLIIKETKVPDGYTAEQTEYTANVDDGEITIINNKIESAKPNLIQGRTTKQIQQTTVNNPNTGDKKIASLVIMAGSAVVLIATLIAMRSKRNMLK